MIITLNIEQREAWVRSVDREFKSYFNSENDADLDSLGWCFFSIGSVGYFSKEEFDSLPIEIKYFARKTLREIANKTFQTKN